MDQLDCLVIGAGVVGLAIAAALSAQRRDVMLVEKAELIGSGVSSRNSEVLHAGLYYPPASLKAQCCVAGRARLAAYLKERHIAHRLYGKLVVARTASQRAQLLQIEHNAKQCGVRDLRLLSEGEARTLEPALCCTAALLSPSSGVIDSHALMLSLLSDAEHDGAVLALKSEVVGATVSSAQKVLRIVADEEEIEVTARVVVNAAGLDAQRIAARMDGLPAATIPQQRLAKGNYFAVAGACPFRHLIYPVPEPGGLGVHLTLDIAGQAKFGPDVQWVQQPDYQVDLSRIGHFVERIRSYWPGLPDGALQPAYAGIRPQLEARDGPADFVISGPSDHGIEGLVNLYGIESPGLTSCLALAERVVRQLQVQAFRVLGS